jgi:hypothetical protein
MGDAIQLVELLRELGYGHPEARPAALEALIAAKLTTGKKSGIAVAKRGRCAAALRGALIRLCERCRRESPGEARRPVPVQEGRDCERCGGSPNRLAVERAVEACQRRGIRRVLVLGGSPGIHAALRALWPSGVELRLVDGERVCTLEQAKRDVAWADVVVVWSSSILPHKVSHLYTQTCANARKPVMTVTRRGIEAFAQRVIEACEGSPAWRGARIER